MKKLLTLGLAFGLLGTVGCGDAPKTPEKKDDKKPAATAPAGEGEKKDDSKKDKPH